MTGGSSCVSGSTSAMCMVEGSDLYGDGVNIAARLEEMAEPGGIVISRKVHEEIERKLSLTCDDLGERSFKNIATPIRVYRVIGKREQTAKSAGLPLPSKPSIAVLPFTNMSGDPEQEYFSDGISEDIITDLSKVSALGVIARILRSSSKVRMLTFRSSRRQLKVSHILEGSVRKAGGRVRITAQLIDGASGEHVLGGTLRPRYQQHLRATDEIPKLS